MNKERYEIEREARKPVYQKMIDILLADPLGWEMMCGKVRTGYDIDPSLSTSSMTPHKIEKVPCICPKGGMYEREDGSTFVCKKCNGTEWVRPDVEEVDDDVWSKVGEKPKKTMDFLMKELHVETVLNGYFVPFGFISDFEKVLANEVASAEKKAREEERDHLQFLYRWISRLNGDKPHDRPETEWKTYVSVMVHYPLSPWNTGDWFEDDITNEDTK